MSTPLRSKVSDVEEGGDEEIVQKAPSVKSYGSAEIPEKKPTALPLKQMTVLGLIQLTESMAITQILPYAAFMIQDFLGAEDDDPTVGYYAGLLSASFPFAQFLTSYHWGALADKVGRRPTLMMGLCGTLFTLIMFGFAVNIPMAIGARLLCGFFNGNNGILKTYLGEILDKSNQHKGFAAYVFVYSVGLIIGPVVGGILAEPSRELAPALFKDTIFDQFPYLLPNVAVACGSFLGILLGMFFLPETLGKSKRKQREGTEQEKQSLLKKETAAESDVNTENSFSATEAVEGDRTPSQRDALKSIDLSKGSLQKKSKPASRFSPSGIMQLCANKDYASVCTQWALLSIIWLGYEAVFPLWAKIPTSDDGWGWEPDEIGIAQSSGGAGLFIMQVFLYSRLVKRFGGLKTLRGLCVSGMLIYLLYPLLARLTEDARMPVIIIYHIPLYAIPGAAVTAILMLLKNSVHEELLGRANGLAQSISSLFKAFGPAVAGAVFALTAEDDDVGGWRDFPLFNRNMIFWLFAIIFLVMFLLTTRLSPALNTPKDGRGGRK